MYYEDLADLLNRDASAYAYYYGLAPSIQEMLQSRPIGSLDEMRRFVDDYHFSQRPDAF